MDLERLIAGHVYLLTLLIVFLGSLGIPTPASVALLALGAAAHVGQFNLLWVLPTLWLAAVMGDTLLYVGGRYTGWWLLSRLCRLTTNPEQCIFRSADYFYRRGPNTLLVAKFVPGLGAMAAPLAGSLNMRFARFLRLDIAGAAIYSTAWVLTGYLFSGFIRAIEGWMSRAGHVVLWILLLAVAGYATSWVIFTIKSRRFRKIERIHPSALHDRLQDMSPDKLVVIADVRSHGYYDPGMQRIKNSIRVEPHRLEEELLALRDFMAPECEIYLYCSCIREATSVRVAYMLNQQNCQTKVIDGGLRGWVKAGGELEPVPEHEIHHLPRFD